MIIKREQSFIKSPRRQSFLSLEKFGKSNYVDAVGSGEGLSTKELNYVKKDVTPQMTTEIKKCPAFPEKAPQRAY